MHCIPKNTKLEEGLTVDIQYQASALVPTGRYIRKEKVHTNLKEVRKSEINCLVNQEINADKQKKKLIFRWHSITMPYDQSRLNDSED